MKRDKKGIPVDWEEITVVESLKHVGMNM